MAYTPYRTAENQKWPVLPSNGRKSKMACTPIERQKIKKIDSNAKGKPLNPHNTASRRHLVNRWLKFDQNPLSMYNVSRSGLMGVCVMIF
ncbi:MAG: hypothetical protein J5821_04460 [Alphaproteobacteria bacterium]|nr:hypothetical protein [Alphaproteobacteria bacterium]